MVKTRLPWMTNDYASFMQPQEMLAQAEKLRLVRQLAGGMAHNFNNLLTLILGISDLGMSELPADHPARKHFEQVQDATERAADLVRRLLLFSGRRSAQSRAVNLNDLVLQTKTMLHRLIGEHIELIYVLAPDLGTVKVNPGQMEQVLANLAVNARDAMPGGGQLTIETANSTVGNGSATGFPELNVGRHVKLSVRDTGTGMGDEVRAHLFEPFFTTKEPGQGTGLGLAICFGVVKEAGGDIRAYSEPGLGTTFEIHLPRVEEAATGVAEGSGPVGMPGGIETVLLVEDEPAIRSMAAQTLRRQGYTVLEAADGEEALRVGHEYRVREFDLLLTDLVMPLMGGRELAELLMPLMPRMKVLLTSGYIDEAAFQDGALDPGISFMSKPFTPSVLARRVREVLDTPGPA